MTLLLTIALHNIAIATFLALLVWGVTRVWKNPPIAHVLWLLVLVKLVTPPFVNFDLWKREPATSRTERTADFSLSNSPPEVDDSQFPIHRSPETSEAVVESNRARDAQHNVAPGEDIIPVHPRFTIEAAWIVTRPVLIGIWVCGAAVVALLTSRRIIHFHRLLVDTFPASERLRSVVKDLATQMGLRRVPDLRVVDCSLAPLVWCIGRRATIVLPRRLLSALDEHRTAMLLAHELAHLRRYDHWVRIVELIVSVVYWWNPLVWWVRRELHAVEEQCCDAWVAWVYPDRNRDYAESLLTAVELLATHSQAPVLASPFLNAQTLKERIVLILKGCSQRTASRWAAVWLTLLAAVVIPAGVMTVGAEGRALTGDGKAKSKAPGEENPLPRAQVIGSNDQDEKPSDGAAKSDALLEETALNDKPVPQEARPFQGSWNVESFDSLRWPVQRDEAQTWQWEMRSQKITWKRPGQKNVTLSFTVEPGFTRESKKKRWNDIDFIFLDGPDRGKTCLGSFFWFADTDVLWICFQDPGEKADRPRAMGFNGYDRHTVIALRPGQPGTKGGERPAESPASVPVVRAEKPIANELQVFQGTWNFGLCDSILWNTKLDVIQKTWQWKIQGQEITWIRWGKGIVRLSFTVDPSKTPNQIDFTFLDGPDKGQKCQGIYEFERGHMWLCMTEPGANVDRPKRMEMSSDSQTALIILQDKNKIRTNGETTSEATKAEPAAIKIADIPKPVVTERSPLDGTYTFEKLQSERWPAKAEEFKSWQWTIQGQEIVWTRPKQDVVRFSFTVDPTTSPPHFDLTFLNGPDKGEKCLGIYFASRHEIEICFQDPGSKVDRPTNTGSMPRSHHTSITLIPAQIPPVADEVHALQGNWKFDLYYSDWWPHKLSQPPSDRPNWRWTVKGNEITWTGMKIDGVKLSFMMDPSKLPRQIDLTLLDGPHKGKKLLGIYKFGPGNSCDICFADPGSKQDRPTEFAYGTNQGQTWCEITLLPASKQGADAPAAVANIEDRRAEIDAAIARLRDLGTFVREFHPRGDPQYWVQIIPTGVGATTRQTAENFDDAAMNDVEIIGRGVNLQLHLRHTSVTSTGLGRLVSAGNIEMLELTGPNITYAMLKILPALPLKGHLGLHSDQLTNAQIKPASECQQLTGISLEGNQLGNACLEYLTRLPKLQSVSLGKQFTREAFAILGRLENLTSLDVSELNPELGDLKQVPKLRQLSLSGKVYDDETALTIADTFKSLEEVYLRRTSITNTGVQHLSRLETLKILTLDGSLVTDGMADSIRKMKQLKWLSVGNCAIGDDTLAAVSECPDMWYLFLVSTPVTDKGIAHLVKCKKPLSLYLAHCNSVTDASVESLAKLPDSENLHLALWGSGITEDGVNRLKMALPHAQIRWANR